MAEETAAAPAPEKKKSSWAPVIAMLVLTPAISFALCEFVLIPKLRATVALTPTAEGAAAATAHEAPKAKKAEGGHGGGGHGKESAGDGFSYQFDSIVVNLSGSMGTRYLKASFKADSENAQMEAIVEENKAKLLDVAQSVLSSRTLTDLEQAGAKNILRNDLIARLNDALDSDLITQIYFSEFVVQ